jgi:hypothetical protein
VGHSVAQQAHRPLVADDLLPNQGICSHFFL